MAVFLDDKDLCKRPDLLTKSEKQFSKMDIVAVKDTKDDWVEVVGKRSGATWIDNGWVKSGGLSEESIDVATAKFARIALNAGSEDEKIRLINEILENPDLTTSSFISALQKEVQSLTVETIEIEEEDPLIDSAEVVDEIN